jgi:hypothetical protein
MPVLLAASRPATAALARIRSRQRNSRINCLLQTQIAATKQADHHRQRHRLPHAIRSTAFFPPRRHIRGAQIPIAPAAPPHVPPSRVLSLEVFGRRPPVYLPPCRRPASGTFTTHASEQTNPAPIYPTGRSCITSSYPPFRCRRHGNVRSFALLVTGDESGCLYCVA